MITILDKFIAKIFGGSPQSITFNRDSVQPLVNLTRPKFSIIIGLYNQAHYLPQLIDSLDRQTFKDFEVIFCDDGSTDKPAEVLSGFQGADFPFKIVSQKHRGMRLAKNINNGIREAKGQYCVFIMADSFMENSYLEILDGFMTEEKVACGIRVHVEDTKMGGITKTMVVEMDFRIRKGVIPKETVLLSDNPWEYITGNGLIVPTKALLEKGGWNEKIKGYGGDDTELVAWLYFNGYLIYSVPSLILYHHYHINKETSKGNREIVEKLINQYAGY